MFAFVVFMVVRCLLLEDKKVFHPTNTKYEIDVWMRQKRRGVKYERVAFGDVYEYSAAMLCDSLRGKKHFYVVLRKAAKQCH
jgi:hypothetical protein